MKPSLGSVSHGTMREEDLIPVFADLLRELATNGDHAKLLQECDEIDFADEDADTSLWGEICNELFDALNEYAPDYCHFGAHEGDGSDYGFWPSWDSIDDDVRCGELLKVADLSEVPEDRTGAVLHVNDHGNATLYTCDHGKLSEVWSIV